MKCSRAPICYKAHKNAVEKEAQAVVNSETICRTCLGWGEAAFRLDFIDDDIAALLQKLVGASTDGMSDYEYYIWNKLDKILDNVERLRNRVYFNRSIISIKIIGGDN